MGEDILGIFPRISLVGNEAMEDTQGHRRTPPLPVLKGTGNRGDVLETPFRQKTADLQVRIDSFLQAPKEFENESVFENNGRVALFGPEE